MSGREKIQQKHSERLMKHLSNERKTSFEKNRDDAENNA